MATGSMMCESCSVSEPPQVDTFSHTWTLKRFSKCYEKTGECLVSPKFTGGLTKTRWCLLVYPRGDISAYQDKVAVAVLSCNSTRSIAAVSVTLFDAAQQLCLRSGKIARHSFDPDELWWAVELRRLELLQALHGDALVIRCEMTVHDKRINMRVPNPQAAKRLCAAHCSATLSADFSSLLGGSSLADVVVHVDGHHFLAHRCVLAARSPVFHAMFQQDIRELADACITISDISSDVFNDLLQFIYTAQLPTYTSHTFELLAAADMYTLSDLKFACSQVIADNLCSDNVCQALVLADMHNAPLLKTRAIDFINERPAEVRDSFLFERLRETHPHLVAEALNVPQVRVDSSQQVLVRKPTAKPSKAKQQDAVRRTSKRRLLT